MVTCVVRRRQGNAFVEMVAETEGFEDDLEKALQRAVVEASKSKNYQPLIDGAGEAGERASKEFGRRFTLDARGRLHDERGRFVASMTAAFAPIGFRVGIGFFDRFIAGFAQSAKGAPILGTLLSGVGQIASMFGTLGIPGLVGGLTSILPIIGVLVIVVPLLTSAIFALGGALLSLLGIVGPLPALLFGLLATIAPLVIAFQGFGEAVAAVASGDLEKIDEALKKLSPSARSVVKELQAFMPFFKTLKRDVQEAFFSRLVGGLTRLLTAVGPTMSGGLQNVAFALGSLFDGLARFAASPAVVAFLGNLFQAITDGIVAGGPTIITFLSAMITLANAGLPLVSALLGQIGGAVTAFSEWATGAAKDGSFQKWVEEAFQTLGSILGIGKEFFGLLVDMFALTDDSGQQFLDDVAEAIRQLREFFQSPEGKEFIENMIVLAKDFGTILIWVAGLFAGLIGMFAAAIEAADDLGEAIERLAKKKGTWGTIARFLGGPLLIPFMADGGITTGPSIAGEAGAEAILPLNDPVRAREILNDPQVVQALGAGGGETTVIAYFDGEPFQARIVKTVNGQMQGTARQLTQKTRG
jgi:hypothetical protein